VSFEVNPLKLSRDLVPSYSTSAGVAQVAQPDDYRNIWWKLECTVGLRRI
jgi:hypothetical protein